MLGLGKIGRTLFGTQNDRKVKSVRPLVEKINALEPEFQALSDDEIGAMTEAFQKRLTGGETLDDLLPEAFACVREAAVRTLGLRPFDVQLIGGIFLHQGNISEMKTGEGKTLMATLPVYLNALAGKGVHVVTVNEYLAKRDAEWMGTVYAFLGMTTGVIFPGMPEADKKAAYEADITYGTNNEFGFDYLRDNMKTELSQVYQRHHFFAIVDEVDSILVDEARTPLIISGPSEDKTDLYQSIDTLMPELDESHFEIDEKARQATLTEEGNEFVEELLKREGLLDKEQSMYDPESATLVHHVNQALLANQMFKRDKDYIVRNDEIVLIDEFTGRMMAGRRLANGLHQAIEAKEGVSVQPENVTMASVTFQNYFRLYDKLAGMTGTAMTEAEEFAEIYGLGVVEIPTNLPIARVDDDDQIYRTAAEKYLAVVRHIANAQRKGQPVLVGTTSIEKSELLSNMLKNKDALTKVAGLVRDDLDQAKDDEVKGRMQELIDFLDARARAGGIAHQVLNARFHEQEAQIIAMAGVPGAVTIATNMAGRGTDIQLGGNLDAAILEEIEKAGDGADPVAIRERVQAQVAEAKQKALDAGGLYVLATERHESRRIDNQLRGRSGRQGDPGRTSFFLSLEDDLMRIFGSDRLDKMLRTLGMKEGEAIVHPWVNKALEKAQGKVEAHNFEIRKQLLKYDDVMNDQRKTIFEQRREIMEESDLSETVKDMRDQVIDDLVAECVPERAYADQWQIDTLDGQVREIFDLDLPLRAWADEEGVDDEVFRERLSAEADKATARKVAHYGPDAVRSVEKQVVLQTIDQHWREHLVRLEHLRSVVGFRGYAQRDPLNEYKSEAFGLFESLLNKLRFEVTKHLSHIKLMTQEEQAELIRQLQAQAQAQQAQAAAAMAQPALAGAGEGAAEAQDDPTLIPLAPELTANIGRNDPCPCGSGKKYKHCHGRV